MKKRVIVSIAFIAVVLAGLVVKHYIDAQSLQNVYSGTVEATTIPVQPEVGGRITEILVSDGQKVNAGEVVAKIDDRAAKSAVITAESQLKQVEAKLTDLLGGSRAEEIRRYQANVAQANAGFLQAKAGLDQVKANQEQVQASLKQAKANYDRDIENLNYEKKQLSDSKALYKDGAISTEQMDAETHKLNLAKAQFENSKAQYDNVKAQYKGINAQYENSKAQNKSAKAQVDAAQSALDLALAGYTGPTIQAQKAAVEAAREAVNMANLNLGKTIIKSPVKGQILYKNVELGQVVSPGTRLVTILNTNDQWVRVYVPEALLSKVVKGQQALISVDAYPGKKFKGEAALISDQAEFTPKNVQTKEERTTIVFGVKVQIKEGFDQLKPGMPADVLFE